MFVTSFADIIRPCFRMGEGFLDTNSFVILFSILPLLERTMFFHVKHCLANGKARLVGIAIGNESVKNSLHVNVTVAKNTCLGLEQIACVEEAGVELSMRIEASRPQWRVCEYVSKEMIFK
jgi:hypothetical protein